MGKEGGSMDTKEPELMQKSIEIDMERIRKELCEQELLPGAYCQEYEIFKVIYRFMARRLRRTKEDCYIILLTLTDRKGELPCLKNRGGQMELLREMIQYSIRCGDVYTKYSSCQFLIMVTDLSEPEADMVANRITDAFYQKLGGDADQVLLHHCYPLKAAETTVAGSEG